jgi:hypothetical protein
VRSSTPADGMAGVVVEPGLGIVEAYEESGSIGRRGARRDIERADAIEDLQFLLADCSGR